MHELHKSEVKMANNITEHNVTKYLYIPLISIVSLGAISNILLLIAFKKDPLKCFRNSGTYLIMNLSVSDLLTCIFAPFFLDAIKVPELDKVSEFLVMSSANSSMLSLVSISIDRFLLVTYPMKHRYLMDRKVMILWLFSIWLLASVHPSLALLIGKSNVVVWLYCFNTTIIVISGIIYAITYLQLKKHSNDISSQNSTESRAQEIRNHKDKKFLKTIILLACIAFVCLVPSMIYFVLKKSLSYLKDGLVSGIFHKLFIAVFYTNFAVNPLIYVLRLPIYKRTFSLIYCKKKS